MADFLANLAARSLDQLPSVQPRNPSRFESDAARGQERTLDEFELEVEPTRPAIRAAAPRASRDSGPDGDEILAPPGHSYLEVDGEAQRTVTDVVEHVREISGPGGIAEPLDEAAQAPHAQTRVAAPYSPDPVQPVIQLDAESALTTDLERAPASQQQARRESGPPAVAASRDERLTEVVREPAGDPGIIAPAERTTAAAETPAGALRVATRIAAPAGAHDAPRSSEPAQAAPQVTVSIGRIEVKAAPRAEPVRPTPPAAKPQPALSLGEYLERSRKGRR